jgi:hypothetical protein
MRQLSAAGVLGLLVLGCGGDDGASPADAGAAAGRGGAAVSGKGGSAGSSAGRGGGAGSNANAGAQANAGARASAGAHAGGAGAAAGGKGGGGTAGSAGAMPAAGVPALDPPIAPGDPGSADVSIEVRTDGSPHLIDPLIYGTNGATEIDDTHQTVVRSGGNRMTAYNWENNASNAGSDYMFENDAFLSSSTDPAKPILDGIAQATSHQAAAIVTVPIVDYVAADTGPSGDVRNSGSNYLSQRFKQNKSDKGSAPAAQPDTSDAFVYQDEFVAFLEAHAAGSQILYSLDNEPDLWSSTHAEVHPDPVTYAELWARNQRFASAIKRVSPDAAVLGFVSYGWTGYVSLQNAPDANGRDFIEWYLDQAKAAETSAGKRLIDYLDLHWYPEAQGSSGTRITEKSSAADVVAAREQAPRSLWDTTYNEKSWIHDDALNGPIELVPRMLAKISAHYPGTKLSFSEWDYGGGADISGAIAVADVLGVFGREGVSLATYWPLTDTEPFTYAAFRAYRNYDGAGATFGDVSLAATSSDDANVTAYASLHGSDPDAVVIVVINKANASKSVGLSLAHPTTFKTLGSYELSGSTANLSAKNDSASVATNAWHVMVPAQSVTVFVPKK